MDDIATIGSLEKVKRGIRNCTSMEVENEFNWIWSRENKIYDTKNRNRKTGSNRKGQRWSYTKGRKIQIIRNNHEWVRQLKGHIEDLAQKCETIKGFVKLDKKRWVKSKWFDTCLTALTYDLVTWANIRKEKSKEPERIQGKPLNGGISTLNNNLIVGLLMETSTWQVEQEKQYTTMLYHNIWNSDEDRNTEQSTNKQAKITLSLSFIKK